MILNGTLSLPMTFKQQVYQQFQLLVTEKITLKQQTLADLRNSAANETKSTAGDKHETALAMLQIEQANTGRQLDEILLQKNALDKIDPLNAAEQVALGSLVETSNGYLFVSAALGKLVVNDLPIIALSPQSPLGSKLLGLQKKDEIEVNGRVYTIIEIW